MATGTHPLVVAIDIGTAYSGYAFSSKQDFQKDPTKVLTYTWNRNGRLSLKTPTCVLFDDERNFHSFGFEAEEKYEDLAVDNSNHDWLFFRRFKMQICKAMGMKRNFYLKADNGQTMDAMTVFSAAIRYLKDHFLEKCIHSDTSLYENDVLFVLSVPAIWSDQEKQFMREAAEKAGIETDSLLIALEPDAVALYYEYANAWEMASGNVNSFHSFQPGSKYLVMDVEDKTIDITVHEVKRNKRLTEILTAYGRNWGGTSVDEAFWALLEDLVGENVMQAFRQEHEYDMSDLFKDFEWKKRRFTPEMKEKTTIKIPVSLLEIFMRLNTDKTFKSVFDDNPKYSGKIKFIDQKLRMEPEIIQELYTDTMDNLVYHVRKLLQDKTVNDAECILMVGGLSESPMLQQGIQTAFPQKVVVIFPNTPHPAMKGAVIFGHLQPEIDHHMIKYTPDIEASP